MLIRFTRKALGYPSQQKLSYSFTASRKRTVVAAQPVATVATVAPITPIVPQLDPNSIANAYQLISTFQNQSHVNSILPGLAAISSLVNAVQKPVQPQVPVPETKKKVAKKPVKKTSGRVKIRALNANDFTPIEKKDTSNYPKRPENTYMIFRREMMKKMGAEIPKVPYQVMMAKIKEQWEKKDPVTQDRLNKILKQNQDKYNQDKAIFQSEHGKITNRPSSNSLLYRKVKVKRDPSLPKPPPRITNTYLLYCQNHREQVKKAFPNASAPQVLSILSANWHKTDQAFKQQYKVLLEDEKKSYKIKMEEYEKKYGKVQKGRQKYQAVDISGQSIAQKIHKEVVAKKEKKITGQDIFFAEKNAEFKASNNPLSPIKQKKFIKLQWQSFTKDVQEKYQAEAKEQNMKNDQAAKVASPAPAVTPAASTTATSQTPASAAPVAPATSASTPAASTTTATPTATDAKPATSTPKA